MKKEKKTKTLLSDYPFTSCYVQVDAFQMHYIDEGKKDAPILLFLHGVPTWSYLFRNIIPQCIDAGNRVIALDLIGFGKSDKLLNKKDYSLEKLVEWLSEFILKLKLKNIVLFAHDWGAILGLIVASKNSNLFAGIICCNGLIPELNKKTPLSFKIWKHFTRFSPLLPIGKIIEFATIRKLGKKVRFAYNLPFLTSNNKIAVRALPQLVPVKHKDVSSALISACWKELNKWKKPFLTVFSDNDPVTKGGEKILQRNIPGTNGQPHKILKGKHFLPEDAPLELAHIINEFVKTIA